MRNTPSYNISMIRSDFIFQSIDVFFQFAYIEFFVETLKYLIHTASITITLRHLPIQLADVL
jgi:predicted lipase